MKKTINVSKNIVFVKLNKEQTINVNNKNTRKKQTNQSGSPTENHTVYIRKMWERKAERHRRM
jgi:hypothetical protein